MIKLTTSLIITIIIGVFLIYAAIKTNQKKCQQQITRYKSVPENIKQKRVSEIFAPMFDSPTVFLGRGLPDIDVKYQ